MIDLFDVAVIIGIAALVFAVRYGINCLTDANSIIKKCKKAQEYAEKEFLEAHPLCIICQNEGRYRKATQVFIETNGNWQPRCEEHCTISLL